MLWPHAWFLLTGHPGSEDPLKRWGMWQPPCPHFQISPTSHPPFCPQAKRSTDHLRKWWTRSHLSSLAWGTSLGTALSCRHATKNPQMRGAVWLPTSVPGPCLKVGLLSSGLTLYKVGEPTGHRLAFSLLHSVEMFLKSVLIYCFCLKMVSCFVTNVGIELLGLRSPHTYSSVSWCLSFHSYLWW